jgi:hypothetical protein
MSLRAATLLAAAGMILGLVIALAYTVMYYGEPGPANSFNYWLEALFDLRQLIMATLFVMLGREMQGTAHPRRRQDLAILATIVSGILLQLTLSRVIKPAEVFGTTLRGLSFAVHQVVLPLCWIAFLILLVKDSRPLESRAMRILAPVMALFTVASACWQGFALFIRVGMGWLNLSSQRSLSAVFWNLLALPFMEVFRDLSMVLFLVLLSYRMLCKKETVPLTT